MSLTLIGIATLVAIVAVWVLRRSWTQYVLGATVAFPQTAGMIVSGNGFPLFYMAVVVLALLSAPHALLGLSRLGRAPRAHRDRLLPDLLGVALVLWAAVITITGPRIFTGMRVFAPELGVDAQVTNMATLAPSLGNFAQLGYLTIGVLFLLLVGRTLPVDSRLIGSALSVAIGLAAVRMVAEPLWPHELLQNMPGFNYATAERLSGTFYEPSVLGLHLTAAAGYFGVRLAQSRGARRILPIVALALVAVEFLRNSSGTALVGLGLLLLLAAVVVFVRMLRAGRMGVRPLAVVGAVVVIGVALSQIPLVLEFTVGSAADKAESGSYLARTASNVRAAQIFLETGGLGVGLGGNRPSSLVMLVVSCLGVIGLGILTALVVIALRRGLAYRALQPAAWGLVGALIAAIIAVPDLSTPVLWAGLAVCLSGALGADQPERATATASPALGAPDGTGTTARPD